MGWIENWKIAQELAAYEAALKSLQHDPSQDSCSHPARIGTARLVGMGNSDGCEWLTSLHNNLQQKSAIEEHFFFKRVFGIICLDFFNVLLI
jgi:hypothetical protein